MDLLRDLSLEATYIVLNEGYRDRAYLDTLNNLTIGVGFNLNRPDAPSLIAMLGGDYNAICQFRSKLLPYQIEFLLLNDIETAVTNVVNFCGPIAALELGRRIVLVDLAFNLGGTHLTQFTGLQAAIRSENWDDAAKELTQSKWAQQVPKRAARAVSAMRTGDAPSSLSRIRIGGAK